MSDTKKLYRSEADLIIAGVAGGLGEYFELDPSLVRLIFILITIAGGSGVLIYLILWLILPTKSQVKSGVGSEETVRKNVKEMESKAKEAVKKVKTEEKQSQVKTKHSKNWLGIILVSLGGLLLLQNLGILNVRIMWPTLLIVIGTIVLLRDRNHHDSDR